MGEENIRGARARIFGFATDEGIVWYTIDQETKEIIKCELERYEEEQEGAEPVNK